MIARTGPYDWESRQSAAHRGDRITHRPTGLVKLHRWLITEYALDVPTRLQTGAQLEADGDPAMTGEAKGYLGMLYPPGSRDQDGATDWVNVACRLDSDGRYVTPMRCAIARIHDDDTRKLIEGLAVNVLYPRDVTESMGIVNRTWADWIVTRALALLWDIYRDAPLPRRTRNSESQSIAEAG